MIGGQRRHMAAFLFCTAAPAIAFVPPQPASQSMLGQRAGKRIAYVSDLEAQPVSKPDSTTTGFSSMRPFLSGVVLGLMLFSMGTAAPAVAADLKKGEAMFEGVCVACHLGGSNLVVEEKTLQKEVLQKYGAYDVNKIKAIVAGGQNAMPAFGNDLKAEELDDVANYVLQQANKGWQ
mmetsp:Transcript_102119/g.202736  ORF Transcript_102119/g.202736 Transcript_102119/m.202736 type:complete len:177 (+) Transcript_102119:83-613(+)